MREVLLVRANDADDKDAAELEALGIAYVADPYLTVQPCQDSEASARAAHVLDAIANDADWLVVTSQAALRALTSLRPEPDLSDCLRAGQARGLRVATVGSATSAALMRLGAVDVLVPVESTAQALLQRLLDEPSSTVIAPQGNQAMKGLAGGLREAGWTVDEQVVYETATIANRPATADRLAGGDFACVVLRSPTAARAVAQFVPAVPTSTALICGGPTTAAEVDRIGLGTVRVSDGPSAASVAKAVQECLAAQH